MRLSVDAVLVDVRVESLAQLPGGAGKFDETFAFGDSRHVEAVRVAGSSPVESTIGEWANW